MIYDDGQGAATVAVAIQRLATPLPPSATACPPRANFPYDQCTREQLGVGTVTIDDGYRDPLKTTGVELWTATLTTPDGKQVVIQEWNSTTPDSPQKSRAHPPLSNEQLKKAVAGNEWQALLSSLKEQGPAPSAPNTPELTKQQIQTTLERLLPPTFTLSDQDGLQGYFSVVADDGHGKALITATIQRWKPEEPNINQIFAHADTLPNGVKIVTRESPFPNGANGTTQWDSDTFRKDGFRVLISELNTTAFGLEKTRPLPPLSISQLSRIALDASWDSMR